MSEANSYGRRAFLKHGAVLAAACWGWQTGTARAEDEASVHGMLIVGEQSVYLSHLPIFGSPHDYQVIMEASFAKSGGNPQDDYFKDRKRSGTKIYTLEPQRFVLPKLTDAAPLRAFKGNVYRGHFERFPNLRAQEGARIGQNVDVNVMRIIHFRKFDPDAVKLPQLEYLLFGKGSELFLAHLVTRPPDFDQILSVKVANPPFSDDELSRGIPIVFPGRANSAARRITGTASVSGQIKGSAPPKTLQLQPVTEFYFEERELAS